MGYLDIREISRLPKRPDQPLGPAGLQHPSGSRGCCTRAWLILRLGLSAGFERRVTPFGAGFFREVATAQVMQRSPPLEDRPERSRKLQDRKVGQQRPSDPTHHPRDPGAIFQTVRSGGRFLRTDARSTPAPGNVGSGDSRWRLSATLRILGLKRAANRSRLKRRKIRLFNMVCS